MTPEVNAHFTLNLSNACNWCSVCCMPKGLYISKHEVVEAWDPSKGTIEDAVSSYVRMRQIARRRFSESGLDVDAGLEALDSSIDLLGISKSGEPPTAEVLSRTAEAISTFLGDSSKEEEGFFTKWLRTLFS